MIINEAGGDIEELYQELSEEKALANEYGLEFNLGGKEKSAPEPAKEEDDEPPPKANGKGNEKGNGKMDEMNA